MKLSRCRLLRVRPLTGTWYRAIRPNHFSSSLAYAHTATSASRFNAGSTGRPGFPVLYFGEDHLVCLFEVAALVGSPLPGQTYVPNALSPWTVVNVSINLSRVVDLSKGSQRGLIGTTAEELTGDWRGYALRKTAGTAASSYRPDVPTQRLGAALHTLGRVEGFMSYSAKVPTKRNLIVFPDRFRTGSSVSFVDLATQARQSIP